MSAPVFVSSASGNAVSLVTSVAIPYPTGGGANNLLLLWMVVLSGSTITTPAGWTLLDTQTNSTVVSLYGKLATGSESGSLTVTVSSCRPVGLMERYSGNISSSLAAAYTLGTDNQTTSTRVITSNTVSFNGVQLAVIGNSETESAATTLTVTGTGWSSQSTAASVGTSTIATAVNDGTGSGSAATFTWAVNGGSHQTTTPILINGPNSGGFPLAFGSL